MCVSYATANQITKSLALNHDQRVRDWKSACSATPQQTSTSCNSVEVNVEVPPSTDDPARLIQDTYDSLTLLTTSSENTPQGRYPDFIIVGDNVDKNVTPRDMRVDHLTKSYHYFHSYAVRDRVDLTAASNVTPDTDVESLSLTCFLPSLDDCKRLRDNYIVLASRVLVEHLRFLAPLKGCVPEHIQHKYSKEMMQKSEIVRSMVLFINKGSYLEFILYRYRLVSFQGTRM